MANFYPPGFETTKKVVAIDFDGVLHDAHQGWGDGTCYGDPLPGAIEAVKKLAENYDIVIRARTDIYFDEIEIEKNDYLNIPWGWRCNTYWDGCGGPIDMFAYSKPEIMDFYSSVFLYLTRSIFSSS